MKVKVIKVQEVKIMVIKKSNKVVEFFKRFGVYVVAGAIVLGVGLTFGITALTRQNQEVLDVGNKTLEFTLPMNSPTIIKDFSSTALQENETLNQWEAHLALDMKSDDGQVFCILDGTVEKVYFDQLGGNTIVVKHVDGLTSVYASLGKEIAVKAGDKVTTGEKLGMVDKAAGEDYLGEHLHFYMTLNDEKIDPNNYLDLQNK